MMTNGVYPLKQCSNMNIRNGHVKVERAADAKGTNI